jgi:hypothetical protein
MLVRFAAGVLWQRASNGLHSPVRPAFPSPLSSSAGCSVASAEGVTQSTPLALHTSRRYTARRRNRRSWKISEWGTSLEGAEAKEDACDKHVDADSQNPSFSRGALRALVNVVAFLGGWDDADAAMDDADAAMGDAGDGDWWAKTVNCAPGSEAKSRPDVRRRRGTVSESWATSKE